MLRRALSRKIRSARRRLRSTAIDLRDRITFESAYAAVSRSTRRTTQTRAVVVHLHYPEAWSALAPRLHLLEATTLVVTVNAHSHAMRHTIVSEFPDAICVRVPNRGRDVLPFLCVARALDRRGYTSVLKLHSKKSTHFEAGDQWRDAMVDDLLPEDPGARSEVLTAIDLPDTGMVGPGSARFPLSTYWKNNAVRAADLLRPHVSADQLARLGSPDQLAFFAGTMFWTRLDAVRALLKMPVGAFRREPIPKDGELVHALERALCLLPALSGRRIYTSDGGHVSPEGAQAASVPQWYLEAVRAATNAARSGKQG